MPMARPKETNLSTYIMYRKSIIYLLLSIINLKFSKQKKPPYKGGYQT